MKKSVPATKTASKPVPTKANKAKKSTGNVKLAFKSDADFKRAKETIAKVGQTRLQEIRSKLSKKDKNARSARSLPTQSSKKYFNLTPVNKKSFKYRKTLTPGTVLILLAGRHKGKRVVLLKQMEKGLLLVTGPFKVNGVPIRRVNHRYAIATKTKLNISSVKVPEHINSEYFKRTKLIENKKDKVDQIFSTTKKVYKHSENRAKDQKTVDSALIDVIKKHPQGKILKSYLRAKFSLKKGQYPHSMVF